MKLHSLKIIGFRRIAEAEVNFGDATFLIGANNAGKSSILRAIEYVLSAKKKIPGDEYYSEIDEETGEQKPKVSEIIIEAKFGNLPADAENWRGFRGRVFDEKPLGDDDTGKCIYYRKTYPMLGDCVVEILSRKRTLKSEYEDAKIAQDLVDAGLDAGIVEETFGGLGTKLTRAVFERIQDINEAWDIEDETEWFVNPGGIPGIVLSKLPKFLLIPEESNSDEIDNRTGVLNKTLNELFSDVRDSSENYKQAQTYLTALANELNPADETSDFGKLMGELNSVLTGVFPDSSIHATADLNDPDSALKPSFDVKLESNIKTSVNLQGTGMIRSVVFALLRYRHKWLAKRAAEEQRGLIIGFEEPEIYLHPGAANQMRNTIYELSDGQSQIVATTHSPYLIDLSRKPRQVLNRFSPNQTGVEIRPFNVTDEYMKLEENDKSHIKMILKIDDYVARAFFTKTVFVIEGDTEDIVIREALRRLSITDNDAYLRIRQDFEVIKARGKASIIPLVKYLKALGLAVVVMHDRDQGVDGAEKFNAPIAGAVGDPDKLIVLEECLEDVLGYPPPSAEKPFKAYEHTKDWPEEWEGVPEAFRNILSKAFSEYIT